MSATLLAIDTATDACSLALRLDGHCRAIHRIMPRQQQQRVFSLLDELLDGRRAAELGLDAVVFGRGPGSFTGLRIAAAVAQGLAYSLRIPVVGVSSLEAQASGYLRRTGMRAPGLIVSSIDARIGQIYLAFFYSDGGRLDAVGDAQLCRPEALRLPERYLATALPLHCVGDGFRDRSALPAMIRASEHWHPESLPEAEDLLTLGERLLQRGETLPPAGAVPDYLQERIGWKTLAEQGKRA